MMAGAMTQGAGARPRPLVRLLAGLAGMLLAAAAVVATQVPPRPVGRTVLVQPPTPVPISRDEATAAQARIDLALGVLRGHAIAQRLAEADAVLAAVRAAADPEAVATWEAAKAAAMPFAVVEEPPPPMPHSEAPHRLDPVEEVPPAVPLDAATPDTPGHQPADPVPHDQQVRLAPGVTRLFIHHAARHADAHQIALALPDSLVLAEIRVVRATPARPDIRYFHAPDRAAAERLAGTVGRRLGPALPVRDFTHYRPLPQPGSIELWLAQP